MFTEETKEEENALEEARKLSGDVNESIRLSRELIKHKQLQAKHRRVYNSKNKNKERTSKKVKEEYENAQNKVREYEQRIEDLSLRIRQFDESTHSLKNKLLKLTEASQKHDNLTRQRNEQEIMKQEITHKLSF